jgi:hypothetical protein
MNRNYQRVLLTLAGFTVVFGLFFWAIFGGTSAISKKIEQVRLMQNSDSILGFYQMQNEATRNNEKFKESIISKLKDFNLSQLQIDRYATALGAPLNYNVIIVPDVSDRIKPSLHPGQVQKDVQLINAIYDQFINIVIESDNIEKLDRLQFDFTNPSETKGLYDSLAKKIKIDFGHDANSFSKDSIKHKRLEISQNIQIIYDQILKDDLWPGDDYWTYLNQALTEIKIPNNTLEQRWANKLIFITDGDLFANGQPRTPIPYKTPIQSTGKKFNNVEIFITQVCPRKPGDGLILRKYWQDWLTDMEFMNVVKDDNWWSVADADVEHNIEELHNFLSLKYSGAKISSKSQDISQSLNNKPPIDDLKTNLNGKKKRLLVEKKSVFSGKANHFNADVRSMHRKNKNSDKPIDPCEVKSNAIYDRMMAIQKSDTNFKEELELIRVC